MFEAFKEIKKILNSFLNSMLLEKIEKRSYPNFSIMVTTGFIMTKAGVAATLAQLTGIALLANPWSAAALTTVAMGVAGSTGAFAIRTVGDFFSNIVGKFNQSAAKFYSQSVMAGMIVGLSLATVVTPRLAVLGGFFAAIEGIYSNSFFKTSITAKIIALLTPLAPLSALPVIAQGLGMLATFSISVNNNHHNSLPVMAATGFIMVKAGVAATLAKLTGLALLANPWGAAALTVVAMGMAGRVGDHLSNLLIINLAFKLGFASFNNSNNSFTIKKHEPLMLESFFATQGLIVGLGLATVLAPWLAVIGGFSAMIAERVIHRHYNSSAIQYAGTMLSLIPFAPTAATGFALRGAAATAAMVPSAVAAWTPTLGVVSTALGSVGYAIKEVISPSNR